MTANLHVTPDLIANEELLSHPVIKAMIELSRLKALMSEQFASAYSDAGLSRMEIAVLVAVSVAPSALTVPQIGRSTGHLRQVIQKAANSLIDAHLIETFPNPNHKRAPLLRMTAAGHALAEKVRSDGVAVANQLLPFGEPELWLNLSEGAQHLRHKLEELTAKSTR